MLTEASRLVCVSWLNRPPIIVTNGAIVIHTQRLKSDPRGNLLS
ncbi:coproporphyrinogen III oxidase [Salmonella enterica subsp. salamae]|nr:coproporphyrinogen III oxidase [Salmonella enterica subsp. enterica serovar Kottbus]ECG0942757.1 coproporphyrinogen III oxidase [Salmonella enterica subsp. salamae]EBW1732905.1 coproporphyrinogen III oxidase [Salmonella enterica subsp. enterica serovar Kottbus]EBY6716584.1 coproporphyrinogen III oxidase [Salmonella enterica subsp. enterica serovar Kottbus]EBZ6410257.1 coproporphyrinogen III oxidase [Salmonella enterica subsp. enterica serovar Kottbus]